MTQVFVRKNPFSDAIAGVHCGLAPAILLITFTPMRSEREFLFYLLLGCALSLAIMFFTGDLRLNFTLPYIVSFAFFLGMVTKMFTKDVTAAMSAVAICTLFYIGLHLLEIRWRKYNP